MMDKHQPPFYVVEGEDSTATIFDAKHRPLTADGAVALLNAPPAWIPVSERLPGAGQTVIVADARGVGMGWLAVEEGGMDWWHESTTHWMPLPNPPAADKTGETK